MTSPTINDLQGPDYIVIAEVFDLSSPISELQSFTF